MPEATTAKKPVVVGLYGVSGCGKSHLLNQLKESLSLYQDHYAFYEGSEVLASLIPGGLDTFKCLGSDDQTHYREQAIAQIATECAADNRAGVVTGHFMFWQSSPTSGGQAAQDQAITPADLRTYTHILYLDVPVDSIVRYRREDAVRGREWMSPDILRAWQDREKRDLRALCMEHGILFCLVPGSPESVLPDTVSTLVEDFREHNAEINLARAKAKMDECLLLRRDRLETVLLLDGDRTLVDNDTGRMLWKLAASTPGNVNADNLNTVFSGPLGYSYTAFRQAALLYEELALDQEDFDRLCRKVRDQVNIDKKFVSFLEKAAEHPHVAAIVVTSGLGRLWDAIVEKAGLSNTVDVIGGGRVSDGFVVTAEVKAGLVDHLHSVYNVHVSAFGDSPLDLPMLGRADDAIVVVYSENIRSKAMDAPLREAIRQGLRARQILMPQTALSPPRMDTLTLPLIQFTHRATIEYLLARRAARAPAETPTTTTSRLRLLHATDRPSAKLLTTPSRDATVSCPALRDAHFRIGQYLATELVTQLVGLEPYDIPHVQGHQTAGHRLVNESRTTIVAILRGGEPMAFGVSAAFPLATFVHAKNPDDIKLHHVLGQSNVLLVDSVVNNGKTVVEFVARLNELGEALENVVVVAGVVQADAVAEDGPIVEALGGEGKPSVVALRLSSNKYTGRGATDTGNRLFNTTSLE